MRVRYPLLAGLAIAGLLLNQRSGRSRAGLETEPLQAGHRRRMPLGLFSLLAAGGLLASRNLRGGQARHSVAESVELDVPVSTAYNQWTQFEEFPRFMPAVEEVRQLDDTHLHWRAAVAGKPKEWDAEITEQIPDQRIAWRSTSGVGNSGVVTFHPLPGSRCRIELRMHYQPQTFSEELGDVAGGVKLTAKGSLKRFKKLVEARGVETGAWRGTVPAH